MAIVQNAMGVLIDTMANQGVAKSVASAIGATVSPTATGTPTGTGTGTGTGTPAQDAYLAWQKSQAELQLKQQQANAIAAINATFAQYGLTSLAGKVTEYVKMGYTGDTVALLLRQTPEYKARFPAMETLAARGQAISEGQYIGYEINARQAEQLYGLPSGMISGNVTNLLINDVSADEINARASMAAANAINAPQDVKDAMASYYGLGQGALTAYFLDPDISVPLLQQQAATARIGAAAKRQGVDIGVGTAGGLQGQGVTEEQAAQGFGTVAGTRGFQYGLGETATQDELISGAFGNADAAKKMNRIAGSRTGRFQGGGQFSTNQQGYAGLGGAVR